MAVFKYRMANILTIKEKLENQAKNEYAKSIQILREEEEVLSELVFKKSSHIQKQKELLREESLNIKEIEFQKNICAHVDGLIGEQTKKVLTCKRDVEQKEQALLISRQERRMHDLLKDAEFEQFVQDEKAAESKEIDELVSFTYGKKQQNMNR